MNTERIVLLEDRRWSHRDRWLQSWHRTAAQRVCEAPVLDMGGGDGAFAEGLQQKKAVSVEVADISPVAVRKAREKGFSACVLDRSCPVLPFRDDRLASVTLIEVLEHIWEPAALLQECRRVARSWVVRSVPNFNDFKFRFQVLAGGIPEVLDPRYHHVHWFNERNLKSLLQECGLGMDRICYVTPRRWLSERIWKTLARIRPSLIAADFVVRCRID